MSVKRVAGPGQKKLEFLLKGIASDKQAKIGWLKRERYKNGQPVAYIAAIQEYGYPAGNIPSRPFFRSTILEQNSAWKQKTKEGAQAILNGSWTTYQMIEAIAILAKSDVQAQIARGNFKPLATATIQARLRRKSDKITVGSLTKPLVDTGFMLSTVSYAVEDVS